MIHLTRKFYFVVATVLVTLFTTTTYSQTIEELKASLTTEKNTLVKFKLIAKITDNCETSEIKFYGEQGLELLKQLSEADKTKPDVVLDNARINNNLCYYYNKASLYKEAQDYAQEAILLLEKNKLDTAKIISSIYNNLGTVFSKLKQYDKAAEIYKKNVAFDLKNNQQKQLAIDYHNISKAFNSLNMNDSAIYYAKKGIVIKEQLGATVELITAYRSLGVIYLDAGNIDSAKSYINRGVNIAIMYKDEDSFQSIYLAKGLLEVKLNSIKTAETYLLQSLQYSKGNLLSVSQAHQELYKIYEKTKDYPKALYHFKQYRTFQDSAVSQEIQNESKLSQVAFGFSQKETKMQQEAEKERIVYEQKQKQQKLMIVFAILIIVLVVIFLLFVLNRARLLRKQKTFIEEQREELFSKNELLDKKNTTITENINYAQTIQGSLIPTEQKIKSTLNKDCFVLFQPKDIVSGDFYWSFSKGSKQLLVVADCTGHGVTGAFISILAIKSLEKVLSEVAIDDLSTILKRLHNDFLLTFNDNSNNHFGIELVLCCFDSNSRKVIITGSTNSVCVVQNGVLTAYPFDSISIGTVDAKLDKIVTQELDLKEPSSIYLYTDGYPDQKGGPDGKKFMSKKLKNTFVELEKLPMQQQKEILAKKYADWKKDKEQIDDVSVIGIKF